MFLVLPPADLPHPSLAGAYGALHQASDEEPAAAEEGGSRPGSHPEDAASFRRHRKLANVGLVIVIPASLSTIAVAGTVGLIASLYDYDITSERALAVAGIGFIGLNVGEAMLLWGSIAASNDARRLGGTLTPTLGWLGVACMASSYALGGVALIEESQNSGSGEALAVFRIASLVSVGGFAFGGAQFVKMHVFGLRHGFGVAMLPDGTLQVAGRF